MSSEIDPGTSDPTAGASAGTTAEPIETQGTPAPQTPAGRTYSDADMAAARRSFEAQSKREREAAINAVRQEYEQRFAPKPATNDPWSKFDPQVAASLREVLEHELAQRLTPYQQQQEDLAFRNDESEVRANHKDYGPNRAAILEYAVQHSIPDVEQAYRAWKFDDLSKTDPDAIGKAAVAAYLKKKTASAATTPSVEGRGGGAPSSKQQFKSREDMDEAALAMIQGSGE